MISALGPLYNATVTVRSETTYDANGDPVLGPSFTVRCRKRDGVEVVDNNGTEHANATVLSTELYEWKTTDRIWLPGDDVSNPAAGRDVLSTGADETAGITLYKCGL